MQFRAGCMKGTSPVAEQRMCEIVVERRARTGIELEDEDIAKGGEVAGRNWAHIGLHFCSEDSTDAIKTGHYTAHGTIILVKRSWCMIS